MDTSSDESDTYVEPTPFDPIQIANIFEGPDSDKLRNPRPPPPPPPEPRFIPPFDNARAPLPMQQPDAFPKAHARVRELFKFTPRYDSTLMAEPDPTHDPTLLVEEIILDEDDYIEASDIHDSTLKSKARLHQGHAMSHRTDQRMQTGGSNFSHNTPPLPTNLHTPSFKDLGGPTADSFPFFPADDPSSIISNPQSLDELGISDNDAGSSKRARAFRYWRWINAEEVAAVAQYVMHDLGGPRRAAELIRNEITIHGFAVLLDGIPVKPDILEMFTWAFTKFIDDVINSVLTVGYVLYRLVKPEDVKGVRHPIVQGFLRYKVAFFKDDTGVTHYTIFDQNNVEQKDIIIYEWIEPLPNGSLDTPMARLLRKARALAYAEIRTVESANNTAMAPLVFRPESRHDSRADARREALEMFYKNAQKHITNGRVSDAGAFSQAIVTAPGGPGRPAQQPATTNRLFNSVVREYQQNAPGSGLFTTSLDDQFAGDARAGIGRTIPSIVTSARDQQVPIESLSAMRGQPQNSNDGSFSLSPFGVRLDPTLGRAMIIMGPGWECDAPAPPPPFPLDLEKMRLDFNKDTAMVTGVPHELIRGGATSSRNTEYQTSISSATFSMLHVTVSKFAKSLQSLVDSITNDVYSRAPFEILEQQKGRLHGMRVAKSRREGENTRTQDHDRIRAWLNALKMANSTVSHKKLDAFVTEQEEIAHAMESWVNADDVAYAFESLEEEHGHIMATKRAKRAKRTRSRASLQDTHDTAEDAQLLALERKHNRIADLRTRITETSGLNTFSQLQIDIKYLSVIYPRLIKEGLISNPFTANDGKASAATPQDSTSSSSYLDARSDPKSQRKSELATGPNRARLRGVLQRETDLLTQEELRAAGRSIGRDSIYRNMDPYGTARPDKAPPPSEVAPVPDVVDVINDQLDTADSNDRLFAMPRATGGHQEEEPDSNDILDKDSLQHTNKSGVTAHETRQKLGALIQQVEGAKKESGEKLRLNEAGIVKAQIAYHNSVEELGLQKTHADTLRGKHKEHEEALEKQRQLEIQVAKQKKFVQESKKNVGLMKRDDENTVMRLGALYRRMEATRDEAKAPPLAKDVGAEAAVDMQDLLFPSPVSANEHTRRVAHGRRDEVGEGQPQPVRRRQRVPLDTEQPPYGHSTQDADFKAPDGREQKNATVNGQSSSTSEGTWSIGGHPTTAEGSPSKRRKHDDTDEWTEIITRNPAKMKRAELTEILQKVQNKVTALQYDIPTSTEESREASRTLGRLNGPAAFSSDVDQQSLDDLTRKKGLKDSRTMSMGKKHKSVTLLNGLKNFIRLLQEELSSGVPSGGGRS